MANDLIPSIIDKSTADAIARSAEAATTAMQTAQKVGGYSAAVLSGLPHNLIGIIGDRVYHKRLRRLAELEAETAEHLRRWGVQPPLVDLSPSIEIPLLEAACDEERAELADIWGRLLAAAYDPKRRGKIRLSLIQALKKIDPLDAVVLRELYLGGASNLSPNARDFLASKLQVSADEVMVSIQNLRENKFLAGVNPSQVEYEAVVAPLGRLLMEAVTG